MNNNYNKIYRSSKLLIAIIIFSILGCKNSLDTQNMKSSKKFNENRSTFKKDEKSTNISDKSRFVYEEEFSSESENIESVESVELKGSKLWQYNYYMHGIEEKLTEEPYTNSEIKILEKNIYNTNINFFIRTLENTCREDLSKKITIKKDLGLDETTKCTMCHRSLIETYNFCTVITGKLYCGHHNDDAMSCAKNMSNNGKYDYPESIPIFYFARIDNIIKNQNFNTDNIRELDKLKNYLITLYSYYNPICTEKIKHLKANLRFRINGTQEKKTDEFNLETINANIEKFSNYLRKVLTLSIYKNHSITNSNFKIPDPTLKNLSKLDIDKFSSLTECNDFRELRKILLVLSFTNDEQIENINAQKAYNSFIRKMSEAIFIVKTDKVYENTECSQNSSEPHEDHPSIFNLDYSLYSLIKKISPLLECETIDLCNSYIIGEKLISMPNQDPLFFEKFLSKYGDTITDSYVLEDKLRIFQIEWDKEKKEAEKKASNKIEYKKPNDESSTFLESFYCKSKGKEEVEVIALRPRKAASQKKLTNVEPEIALTKITVLPNGKKASNHSEIKSTNQTIISENRMSDRERKPIFEKKNKKIIDTLPGYIDFEDLNIKTTNTNRNKKEAILETTAKKTTGRKIELCRPSTPTNKKSTDTELNNINATTPTQHPVLTKSAKKMENSRKSSLSSYTCKNSEIEINGNYTLDIKSSKNPISYTDRTYTMPNNRMQTEPHEASFLKDYNHFDIESYRLHFTHSQWGILSNAFGTDSNTNLYLKDHYFFLEKILKVKNELPEFILAVMEERDKRPNFNLNPRFENTTLPTNLTLESSLSHKKDLDYSKTLFLEKKAPKVEFSEKSLSFTSSMSQFAHFPFLPKGIKDLEPNNLSESKVAYDGIQELEELSTSNREDIESLRSEVSNLTEVVKNLEDKVITLENSGSKIRESSERSSLREFEKLLETSQPKTAFEKKVRPKFEKVPKKPTIS